ncbi:Zn-ribbon-containing, possibly RNA-binding protein and truncated derivatives [Actinomyces bovis]|uniref:Zn-ribbon-containing, possibly RNA-binding protein and truncated derivatives n=1 Tax=Actinomyces bovis TaxID=1658 RepID=A0ABY1VRW4_9ACTO|nr:DciA family protein [Actinomyces bovis]SPT54396.1 Zn-ribbon-containing, possibly RNA-binding protein and truncated derivatives [Actinomyces bovis]VEG56044.1 Zn-ribbon-containing, possibly RNA-binding protein and truncated derivatives [Actinomyces israelii]
MVEAWESAGDALAQRALARQISVAWDRGLARRAAPRRTADGQAAAWDQRRGGESPEDLDPQAPAAPGLAPGKGRPGPSRFDPHLASKALRATAREKGWNGKLRMAMVIVRWPELVGEQVAEHCVVESFDEGVLTVRASSSAWAQQLRLLQPRIEALLAEQIGQGAVTKMTVLGPQGPSWCHGKRTVRNGRGPRDTYG